MSLLKKQDIEEFYQNYYVKVQDLKRRFQRPLTLTEKILFSHLADPSLVIMRGKTSLPLRVDRVAMQDATAQMAILQFMLTSKPKVLVPTTVHCDHLIRAQKGALSDLQVANLENNEVYTFLKSSANKYGMGFWKPGSGIIHQVVLENYAVPGMLMIGTDSHTPNAGGLSMIAIGVGGADAVDAMAGKAWNVRMPKIIGIKLTGKLNGWSAPKDVILKIAGLLTVKGGTGHIVEYFGDGCNTLSATGKATITNMGAEIGATTSLFPYSRNTSDYLKATNRDFVAHLANNLKDELQADKEVLNNPQEFYNQLIEINLDTLEPHIVGPHTPDLARPISQLGQEAKENGWPLELKQALIGSCTNSSYEDMSRAASVAKQAIQKGLKTKSGFMVTPGSIQIHDTITRDGQLEIFQKVGGIVLANACGPCIGQWARQDIQEGESNSIITSYNRNFKKRNDANPHTNAFIASPEIVTALALAGRLDFNPLTDTLNGELLDPPQGDQLPKEGFIFNLDGYEEPTGRGEVRVNPSSERIALLQPFTKPEADDYKELPILVKAKGKCTTDHISPAGKWLKYRGHLDNISKNMYSGAVNAFGENLIGKGTNVFTREKEEFHTIARDYNNRGKGWIVVGDINYGEGSSREHAAMEPRHLGCKVVVAKSFARIAETNLKRQGVIPLIFINEEDYDKFEENDRITVDDINLHVNSQVELIVYHEDGVMENIPCTHTFTQEQLGWFRAGSALNTLRN